MRVLCRHGHFAFFPEDAGDINRFRVYYGQELVRVGNYYTFPGLEDAPKYSLLGSPYLGVPATKTFEGEPWEVMEANGFVYFFETDTIGPKELALDIVSLARMQFYFLFQNQLIQPGSRLTTGEQILSYDGDFSLKDYGLRILGLDI